MIRNERILELAIYFFSDGERFEPDFLLFIEKDKSSTSSNYQVYIEPKGGHLLYKDEWKEKFLLEIEAEHEVENTLVTANKDYMILGLPFFNAEKRIEDFEKKVKEWLEQV